MVPDARVRAAYATGGSRQVATVRGDGSFRMHPARRDRPRIRPAPANPFGIAGEVGSRNRPYLAEAVDAADAADAGDGAGEAAGAAAAFADLSGQNIV